ncbi:MAG TPA: SGNH/GDSL hydrolase family protein, partial [Steroidobacteraceae bacterium]|nr:SGNH/GDSL hydrolase family protein [Steroidobacteraceae bacterium]
SATDDAGAGAAGSPATAGAKASGGAPGSAGSPAVPASGGAGSGSGGLPGSSGSPALGQAGTPSGAAGAPGAAGAGTSGGGAGSGSGGTSSTAGAGTGGKGGTSTGGTSAGGTTGTGTCTKGQTKGNQVAVIGESFIALSHGITQEIEKQAKANGSLGANEKYVDNSVSGTLLSGNDMNAIPKQYARAAQGGMIKYVLMDGGGNDCLQANNGDAALTAAKALFPTMAKDGVEKVVYFFYPDPLGSLASGTLKTCLDALRPKMKELCDGLTAPKCYWMDLRTLWNGHNDYAMTDGIHPTAAGSVATGDAIWETMKKNCVAQ